MEIKTFQPQKTQNQGLMEWTMIIHLHGRMRISFYMRKGRNIAKPKISSQNGLGYDKIINDTKYVLLYLWLLFYWLFNHNIQIVSLFATDEDQSYWSDGCLWKELTDNSFFFFFFCHADPINHETRQSEQSSLFAHHIALKTKHTYLVCLWLLWCFTV